MLTPELELIIQNTSAKLQCSCHLAADWCCSVTWEVRWHMLRWRTCAAVSSCGRRASEASAPPSTVSRTVASWGRHLGPSADTHSAIATIALLRTATCSSCTPSHSDQITWLWFQRHLYTTPGRVTQLPKIASWWQRNEVSAGTLRCTQGCDAALPWQWPGQKEEQPTEEQDAHAQEHWLQRQTRRERSAAAPRAARAAAALAERRTALTPPLPHAPCLRSPCMQEHLSCSDTIVLATAQECVREDFRWCGRHLYRHEQTIQILSTVKLSAHVLCPEGSGGGS